MGDKDILDTLFLLHPSQSFWTIFFLLHLIMAGSAGDLLDFRLLELKGKNNFLHVSPLESLQPPVPLSSGQCALSELLMI